VSGIIASSIKLSPTSNRKLKSYTRSWSLTHLTSHQKDLGGHHQHSIRQSNGIKSHIQLCGVDEVRVAERGRTITRPLAPRSTAVLSLSCTVNANRGTESWYCASILGTTKLRLGIVLRCSVLANDDQRFLAADDDLRSLCISRSIGDLHCHIISESRKVDDRM